MKSNRTGIIIRYGIVLLIGLLLMGFVLWINDYGTITDEAKRLKVLADSTTVPGMVLILVAILAKLSDFGAMDGLGYAMGGLVRRLIPGGRWAVDESYLDYVTRKRAKKKGSVLPLLIVGALFMAVSFVFIYKFYQVY